MASQRVTIPVSRRNYNRVKGKTHTLAQILKQEGYQADDFKVLLGGREVRLQFIDLYPKTSK